MSHASIHTDVVFFDQLNLAKNNCSHERALKPLSHQGGVLKVFRRRPNKLQNAEVRAIRSQPSPQQRGGNAVASPLDTVGSHRTPSDGTHFEYAQNSRRSAIARCSNKSAVGSP